MGIYSFARSMYWRARQYPATGIKEFLLRSQHWNPAQLNAYRDERIRSLIAHCYENVPYYRRVMLQSGLRPQDVRTVGDLQKLPLLTRADVRAHAEELIATNSPQMRIIWTRTGGTTGEPMGIAKDSVCSAWENMCLERGLEWGGLSLEDKRITLFGGSLGVGRSRATERLGGFLRRDTFLPAFELRSDTALEYFRVIRRSDARFLLGYASAIYRLAVLAQTFAPDIRFDAVFPTAEVLPADWEDIIRGRFHCRVLPYYGCGEVNSLGFSTPDIRYLIPEEQCVIEIRTRDGSIVSHGEGDFVITSLVNRAMPIVRYVNGDAGCTTAPSAPFPFSRIARLDGRSNSFLMTENGDLISGAIGAHIFRYVARSVESYRIIQEAALTVTIEIVPRRDAQFSIQDEELIRSLFIKHLGARMTISIETVSSIPQPPSGKAVFVFNRLL